MNVVVPLFGVILALMPTATRAQVAPPSGEVPPPAPDIVQSCRACHGARGEGNAASGVPRIAALSRYYSAKQFESYMNGTRQNPAMEAIARSMSPQDVAIVAAHFEQTEAPRVHSATPTARTGAAERGRQLATTGSEQLRVQACNNCHGPAGTGQPPMMPYLAGQVASYIVATLDAWREGTRRNDAGEQMAVIARALTPDDIAAVARYYAGLTAPLPAPPVTVQLPDALPATGAIANADSAIARPMQVSDADLSTADPDRGHAILSSGAYGCMACHTIPGVRGANGVVGPPLDGMAQRGFIAGQLPNRPVVLVGFIQNPRAMVANTGMPTTGVTREEAVDIAAYLYTLVR